MSDLALLDGTAQAELVHRGDVKPAELVEAAMERIERVDQMINAVPIRLFERALREAATVDVTLPFPGVPTVVKDTVPTGGDPWHRGMALLRGIGHRAPADAHVVARMRASGMAIVGKGNVGELEGGITVEPVAYGPTCNPWDLGCSVGGSSGGPAAAVAAGLVPIGLGVDGGGSIRIPSSICGVVGLKPSRGRTSLFPLFVEDGASTAGPIARSVRDCAAALDAMSGRPRGDHFAGPAPVRPLSQEVGSPPGRLRIGAWAPGPGGITAHPDCVVAVDGAAKLLASLGHDVDQSHPGELDSNFFHQQEFVFTAVCHMAYQVHQIESELGRPVTATEVEPVTAACLAAAQQITAIMLEGSIDWNRHAAVRYASWWDEGWDLLLTPTIAVPPYPLGALKPTSPDQPWPDVAPWVPFTPHANMSGHPAISLPLWWNDAGLPIGVQLVADYGREDLLIRVASQLEAARPWADRRPPVFA